MFTRGKFTNDTSKGIHYFKYILSWLVRHRWYFHRTKLGISAALHINGKKEFHTVVTKITFSSFQFWEQRTLDLDIFSHNILSQNEQLYSEETVSKGYKKQSVKNSEVVEITIYLIYLTFLTFSGLVHLIKIFNQKEGGIVYTTVYTPYGDGVRE